MINPNKRVQGPRLKVSNPPTRDVQRKGMEP